jgi:hypothetical protein
MICSGFINRDEFYSVTDDLDDWTCLSSIANFKLLISVRFMPNNLPNLVGQYKLAYSAKIRPAQLQLSLAQA